MITRVSQIGASFVRLKRLEPRDQYKRGNDQPVVDKCQNALPDRGLSEMHRIHLFRYLNVIERSTERKIFKYFFPSPNNP